MLEDIGATNLQSNLLVEIGANLLVEIGATNLHYLELGVSVTLFPHSIDSALCSLQCNIYFFEIDDVTPGICIAKMHMNFICIKNKPCLAFSLK
jgi:hypothetical protein